MPGQGVGHDCRDRTCCRTERAHGTSQITVTASRADADRPRGNGMREGGADPVLVVAPPNASEEGAAVAREALRAGASVVARAAAGRDA